RTRERIVEESLEIVRRKGPTVALILRRRLQERERRLPAALVVILDRPSNRNDGRARRDLRQKTPHFPFGIHAPAQAPIRLEEQSVADEKRRVRALGRRAAHRLRIEVIRQQRLERSSGLERQRAAPAPDRLAFAARDAIDEIANEFLLRERVEQDPGLGALSHACERGRLLAPRTLLSPVDRERQEIGLSLTARETRLDRGHQPLSPLGPPQARVGEPGVLERFVFCGEPALLAHVSRQHLAFELLNQPSREVLAFDGAAGGEARERIEQDEPRRG